jgi:hypothetical protein
MAEVIGKTWTQILEGSLKLLWRTMDDEQKLAYSEYAQPYVGKTTSDDVRMTWEKFGQAVGTTGDALKSYYRRSQGLKGGAREESMRKAESHARVVARENPDAILSDREARRSMERALARAEAAEWKAEGKKPLPDISAFARDLTAALAKLLTNDVLAEKLDAIIRHADGLSNAERAALVKNLEALAERANRKAEKLHAARTLAAVH